MKGMEVLLGVHLGFGSRMGVVCGLVFGDEVMFERLIMLGMG